VIVDAVTELHAAWAPGRRIVARDGGLLRPDGVLVVGADGAAGTAALRRRREAAALRTELEGHDARVAAARAAVDTARAEQESRAQGVRDARAALDTAAAAGSAAADVARTTLRERENQAAEARHRLKGREADRARQRQEAQRLAAEGGQHVADRAALDTEEQRATQATVTAEAEHQRAEEAARAAQLTLERVEPRVREARERLQGARTEADALQREATRAGEAERSAAARVERAAGRGALIAKERSDLETRQDASAGETAAVAGRLQALGEQMGEVRVQLDHVRARIVEEKERVRASDEAVRAARQRRDTVRDAATGLEARLAEVRVHLEQVRADVEPRYELSLPGLLDRLERDGQLILEGFEPPEDGMVREGVPALRVTAAELEADMTERAVALREQREALAKLGEVNLAAEEEYREVQQRHDDIERQRADLRDALEIIDKAIAKINRTCRERFRETFDLVAQHYVEIYARLSGGGVGRLQLTDEDDLLTCGVEQFAQPPGKKVHTLSLLSGGEKALAAIALIFALFRVKPSPFCLLDEVDAPLDEGNGGRFNEMLKEMSRSSQFIIITHNKKTMECADVLYGVTTPEPGISRLVTVRID
jgi:chromosome segregation protein